MINWRVRLKSKVFWVSLIPTLFVLVQLVASLFGATLDLSDIQGKVLLIVDAVFVILSILGIVVDPTTSGISDSNQAMTYTEPKKDGDSDV